MRPRGTGRIYKRGAIFWIQFHRSGKQYRESSKSSIRKDAEALLRTRLYEIANSKFKRREKTTVSDLIQLSLDEAVVLKRHSISTLKGRASLHLIPAIGNTPAVELSTSDVRSYIKLRRKQHAQDSTINRELALLRHAYQLGQREGRCDAVPYIPRLDESGNVRQGYLEHDAYLRLRSELPDGLRLLLVVGYHLGCRLGELRKLKWAWVDFAGGEIRLPGATTKSKQARTLPIYGDMGVFLQAAKAERDEWHPDAPWVFLRRGKRIGAHLKGWGEACERAGVPDLRFHDLRRSAVRNMERAGMPRSLAMRISGHLTESMYRRYAIASESDKSLAAEKMNNYFDGIAPTEEKRKGRVQ